MLSKNIGLVGRGYNPSFAFDAASGNGMAFLSSQLEKPNVDLVQPLASVTHPRDIPIKTGGGYVEFLSAWASDFATSGGNQYGLQGTENTDIAIVQASVNKGIWPALNWSAAFRLSYINLQRLIDSKKYGIPAPYSMQSLLDQGIKLIWNKALDRVTYLGWSGQAGLMNNPSVAIIDAVPGASTLTTWAGKTTTEILNDVNTALLATQENSGFDVAGLADTILVDYPRWVILNQPMTIGGFNSVLEYILANNVAKRQGVELEILPLPDPWIAGLSTVSMTSRLLAYRKNEESLYLQIPQPIQKVFTVPSVRAAGYETLFTGCVGVVQWLRSTTAIYMDGI